MSEDPRSKLLEKIAATVLAWDLACTGLEDAAMAEEQGERPERDSGTWEREIEEIENELHELAKELRALKKPRRRRA